MTGSNVILNLTCADVTGIVAAWRNIRSRVMLDGQRTVVFS